MSGKRTADIVASFIFSLTNEKMMCPLGLVGLCIARLDGLRWPYRKMALEFRPKLDKIVELLVYLAHVRPGADIYQAVKFFYLADREHFRRHGRPITFEQYFALPYGPVATNAMDLLNRDNYVMQRAGIEELPFETSTRLIKGKDVIVIGRPLREVNDDLFSVSDLRVFDEIIAEYGRLSFDELYQLTHGHRAYKRAWRQRQGSNRSAIIYEDMIEDPAENRRVIEDMEPVSGRL